MLYINVCMSIPNTESFVETLSVVATIFNKTFYQKNVTLRKILQSYCVRCAFTLKVKCETSYSVVNWVVQLDSKCQNYLGQLLRFW